MEPRWLDAEQQGSWRSFLLGSALLQDRLDRDLRERHDLSLPEYEILVRLSEAAGCSLRMAVLADSVKSSRSRTTHTISRLERAGLVRRETCPADGRGVMAVLTEAGRDKLVAAAPSHVEAVRASLVDLVSAEDFAAIGRVFARVVDELETEAPDPSLSPRAAEQAGSLPSPE